jgi:hypothetical protein
MAPKPKCFNSWKTRRHNNPAYIDRLPACADHYLAFMKYRPALRPLSIHPMPEGLNTPIETLTRTPAGIAVPSGRRGSRSTG